MDPILYIEVGGVVWAVLPDGSWQPLPQNESIQDGIQVITMTVEPLSDLNTAQEQTAEIEAQLENIVEQLSNNIASQPTDQSVTGDLSSSSASYIAYVRSTLEETLADAGYDTRPDNIQEDDSDRNLGTLDILNPNANLTVDILDGGDGYENQYEVPSVTIKGSAEDIRDGRTVNITITDVNGDSVTVSAIIDNETYSVSGVDLSGLAEGELTVTAVVSDNFGNSISANDSTIKDTLAENEVNFDGFGDEYYNQFEVSSGTLVGTVTHVEDGQPVTITITDIDGLTQTYSALVSNGQWQLDAQDYSGFEEGELTVVASTIDLAGNPTSATDTIVKDTLASITAEVDDGGDNVLNSFEIQSARFFGTVANVEDGQAVTVTLTDSANNKLIVSTTVVNGEWSVDNIDLTGFVDGNINVQSETIDVAGNPAIAVNSSGQVSIDTVPPIIDIDTLDGFSILSFRSGKLTTMQGTTDVDEGLPVYIIVNDGSQTLTFEGIVDSSGNWSVDNIDVSALDLAAEWTIDAKVFNTVGNTASDDMPSIILPETAVFSETVIGIFGDQSDGSDIRIANAEFSFSSDQSIAEDITSQSQSISVTVSGDKQSLIGVRTDGTTVFDAFISGESINITFYEVVDQAAGLNSYQSALIVEGLQTDPDGTTELVIGHLPIIINDSEPVIFDESYEVVEGEITSGNVLNNDIDLDTALTVKSVEVDGVTQTISGSSPVNFTTSEGTLSVFANGHWNFVANRNLDHTIDQNISFNYVAGDISNDFGNGTATIVITDGEAGQIVDDSTSTIETDVSLGDQTVVGQFSVLGGSDNPDPDSLVFSSNMVFQFDSLDITTSNILTPISYSLSDDGKSVIASAGSVTVFTLSLTASADNDNVIATVTMTIERPLNQPLAKDSFTLPITIDGFDLDGTALETGEFEWTVSDGVDPVLTNVSDASVNESDINGASTSATGTFNLNVGSDYLEALYFDASDQPLLFSGGEQIVYTVSPNGNLLTGYVGSVDASNVAFTVSFVEPDGESDVDVDYLFTLYKGLDQEDATDLIPFVLTARDSDKDATQVTLNVSVADGGEPTIGSGTVELSENPRASTIPSGVGSTASVNLSVTADNDPIVFLGLEIVTGQAVLDSDGAAVTQNGEALVWRDNGDGSYDAVLGNGNTVFQIRLPEDFALEANATDAVDVEIDLYQSIDHGTGDKDTEITIPASIVTIDSDGSRDTQESAIKIYDGADPEISVVGSISVDEDGLLSTGEQDGTELDSPSVEIIEGSDDYVALHVDTASFDGLNYTSGGSILSLSGADSDGWYYASSAIGEEIFRIRFNLDGTTEFDLYAPLDHALADGENNLALNFKLIATDADGDESSPATYTVNVTDSVPVSQSGSVEIVEGDSYSGKFLTDELEGADGAEIVSFVYQSTTYTFDASGTPITIDLINNFDADSVYGSYTLNPDGSFSLTTNDNVATDPLDPKLVDSIDYVVRDYDGDEVTSTAELVLDDNEGFIRVEEAQTTEDNSAVLSILVTTGDVDQSEEVTAIEISESSLSGGSLYLNGQLLSVVDGKVTLSSDQLVTSGQFVTPLGVLTYRPALHESNTTSTVVLAVNAIISTSTDPKELSADIPVSVFPVADAPDWSNSVFVYDTVEDSETAVELDITALLVDVDTSESLTYTISDIPEGLNITLNGNGIKEGKAYTQNQINKMELTADANLAGKFEFVISAISTEAGSNFDQSADKTASIDHTVVVNVSPDADKPHLSVKDYKGLEDEPIYLNEVISGGLTDNDGSESLSYQIEVQEGWAIQGGLFDLLGPNTYLVSSEAIENGLAYLVPKEDISSETESLSINVTAVATESTIDALDPVNRQSYGQTETINIYLKGVVDEPVVEDGGNQHWQYDSDTKVISNQSTMNEDGLIRLDFVVKTTDDDESETINLLLTNFPQGTLLVDSTGTPVSLTIAGVDPVTGPLIQVSNDQLNDLYLKPVGDFSGELELTVIAISTEPDGDTGEFPMTLQVTVDPVVDQSDGQNVVTQGIEDREIGLRLEPSVNQDSDGSETLTGYVISSLPEDLTLYFDGSLISVPSSGLDLETLLDSTTPTLSDLLNSGRLSVIATEDLSGSFTIPVVYEVTDTSEIGHTTTKDINGVISVNVEAKVETDTRLEGSTELYSSTDGSAVDVSTAVKFVDADIDGSEYLDYILIDIPDGYSLIVEHPNGAAQDSSGNWIISAAGLTSSSVQEAAELILNNMTISSPTDTPVLDIVVRARVIDGEDSKYINTSFPLQITGHSGGGGSCDPVGPPDSIQTDDEIKTPEGEDIDLSGLLNTDVSSDPSNSLSFYIPASSLPDGVEITGSGVITEYDASGEIVGYSISADGLANLTITGLDEDFAGCIEFTVQTIETSPCNGDSLTTDQTISIQVVPVVDNITVSSDVSAIDEDTVTDLNLELILGDSIEASQTITGEGQSSTGKETVNSLTISVSNGVQLSETPTDTGLLVENGDGSWTVTDPTRLNDIELTPPEHYSGDIEITVTANITDQADCVTETDTQDKSTVVTINVEPVVDAANLVTEDVVGDEDMYISLASMSADLIDQDGSENMSLSLKGVPQGAVIAIQNGTTYELVPNNGEDGGTFDGNPTYEWQLDPSQLSNLVILPPRDFSGDIELSLEAITQEVGTFDIQYTTSDFTVGVNPIGDKVEFFDIPEEISGDEDQAIEIPLEANSFETNSDEFIAISITVNTTSDPTGLEGLDRIRIGSETGRFVSQIDGSAIATVIVAASSVDSVEFFAGNAFGNLDITVTGQTVDQNTVLGELVTDTGDPTSQDVTLIITPEPDAPLLTVEYSSIVAEADGTIPLGLDLSLVDAASNETGQVTIYGLPSNLELSHGSIVNGQYVVELADVPNLSIDGGYAGADTFELIVEPSASIGDNEATGLPQTIQVELVAQGDSTITATSDDDLLIGGDGNDSFVFESSGLGSAASPSLDVINDFDAAVDTDNIDISAILDGLDVGIGDGRGAKVDNYVDLSESADGVTISIKQDGSNVEQNILLSDLTLDDLYQGDSSGATEAEILQKMINDSNLTVN